MKSGVDRKKLMERIYFPENSPYLVIIPSNKEGTGFLKNCYEVQYLKSRINEKEFNIVI